MTVASYLRPVSLPDALDLLERHGPDLLVMAGGTVAMPLINDGLSFPGLVMSLRGAGLDTIAEGREELRIGATVTLSALLDRAPLPVLREAAASTASRLVRNLATVGGNLFTPPPGGDVAVALLALDASVVVSRLDAERLVPLCGFWTGFMTNVLGEDELVTEIRVPLPTSETAYVKFGRKQANTPAVVTVAVHVRREGERVAEVRIALGAVGPHPIRAREAERTIVGSSLEPAAIADAGAAAARECEPIADAIASEWYRRRMVELFVGRALSRLAAVAADGGR